MGKRRLENEIDALSDEVLGDLTPDERLRLTLEAEATGKEGWIDRLRETCPRYRYTNIDHAFRRRVRSALLFAYQAVYDLHTTYLKYQFARNEWKYHMILDYERDETPSDEETDQLARRAEDRWELFSILYMLYHSYRRFATDVLGVDTETWLTLHDGPAVLEAVAEAVDDQREIGLAESHMNDQDEGDADPTETTPAATTDPDTLEKLVEKHHAGLVAGWEDSITNPSSL